MSTALLALAVVLAGNPIVTHPGPLVESSQESIESDLQRTPQALVDFADRIRAYMKIHRAAAQAGPALQVTTNTGEIRQAVDALALGIRLRRPGAKQGDIFSAEIAATIRNAVREVCHENFLELLALVNEEIESPLAPAVVYGRWPERVLPPTMSPTLRMALPRLPPELEYRFINRDLVLIDVDANLIVDVVPDAIPDVTSS